MKKKVLIGLGVVLAIVIGVAVLSAYEAHVINVIARIENALFVDTKPIEFGTVFPQEYLKKELLVSLSNSFLAENQADGVHYTIRQKPKPIWPLPPECQNFSNPQPTVTLEEARAYCHDNPEDFNCCYLSLCPFLSKLPKEKEEGDIGLPSYYQGDICITPDPDYTSGTLSKKALDTSDVWIVDLKVPPVQGYVGQDWPAGCPTVDLDSQDYGCDLWVEVTGISRTDGAPTECTEGDTRACNSGLPGICAAGTQTCSAEGTWKKCIPDNPPTPEVCYDGLDNDCNSFTDCDDFVCFGDPFCLPPITGWKYRRKLTIDSTKIDSDLTDFPVLVKLTFPDFDFSKAKSDGSDIKFTQPDGTTLLKFERERHDSINKVAEYWVKVPSVSSVENTAFYMYYGNPLASDGADPDNVWDSSFVAVYHLHETPTGIIHDSTVNNRDLESYGGMVGGDLVEAKIGKGIDFDGSDDYLQTISKSTLDIADNWTVETWWIADSFGVSESPFSIHQNNGDNNFIWAFRQDTTTNSLNPSAYRSDATSYLFEYTSISAYNTGTWYYSALSWDGSFPQLYKNISLDGSGLASGAQTDTSRDICIGALIVNSTDYREFDGMVDEVRVSKTARNHSWTKASYFSGNNSLLDYGSEQIL